jgi:hypothetical protein
VTPDAARRKMYCQLLENAMRHFKQLPENLHLEVTADLPGPAYLPHDYVPVPKQRMEVYRRWARIRDIRSARSCVTASARSRARRVDGPPYRGAIARRSQTDRQHPPRRQGPRVH